MIARYFRYPSGVFPNIAALAYTLIGYAGGVALLTAGHAGRRVAGAVHGPLRLDQHRLPVLAADEVHRLDLLLNQLHERRRAAQIEIDMLDELCRITTGGVCDGTLTITAPPTS